MKNVAIVFYYVLNMSIMASVMGFIVLWIRKNKWIPRRMAVLLWIIPFLRAILPFGMNSSFSLMNTVFGWFGKTIPWFTLNQRTTFSFVNYVMLAQEYEPFQFSTLMIKHVFFVLSIVWMTGMVFLITMLMLSYYTGKRDALDAEHWKDDLWFSSKVQGAAVFGIIKPRIVFPIFYKDRDLRHILQHERMHIKRKDNLWRVIGFGIIAIHWFNPLLWFYLKAFLSDLEMACDEAVISKYDDENKRQYALTLLECKENEDLLVSAFGGANLSSRVKFVISYRKMMSISLFGLSVVMIFLFYALLTNA